MTVCTFARLQIVFICCLYFHLQQSSRLKQKEDKKYLILPYWSSANKQITIQAKKYKIFEKIKTGGTTLDRDYIMSSFLSWGYRRLSCLGVVDVFPVFGFSTLQGTYIHTHSSLCLGNRRVAFFDYIATRKTRLSINEHTKSDQNHE
jgi:hypothetical protein